MMWIISAHRVVQSGMEPRVKKGRIAGLCESKKVEKFILVERIIFTIVRKNASVED